ncbi:acyltransferase domain-containing protein [Streptomyces cocklensis]|uniref:Beta-ketoacyl synthase n=1 Tax=Actinacidiphila cocklensis TaxID=887465 RepID=A0A9W4EAA9_9ACTN|nr:type I polyketide synthase [Actinacidiphila cocklensis]MDD1059818.1 acyltransferase domain-containing protein [Actinacidiphila cocklensis]CAG6397096.1 Beta-ketoacyl synthase [Actinacidiphila cocklensis]
MTPPGAGTVSADTLKRAYLTMERLQRQVEEYERARTEPVAVVGVGCRFPGGVTDAASYWSMLLGGTDGVGEIPADRWDHRRFYDEEAGRPGKVYTRSGGFIDGLDRFDHDFFGISRREAMAMDPHQWLTLQVAWEALEDAGQAPSGLAGSRTGVFMGAASSDYVTSRIRRPEEITAYTSSGAAASFVPARIAYLLDLRGPNITVDTACSSSLVAVHQACQSLRSGESDLALAGGVNAVLSPVLMISQSQFGSVSRQGRAMTFSDTADGYVRGEGCGVVVLKRLSDAVRDRDRVLAVVRGGAVNQDGRSAGITAPNGAAQADVFRRALAAAGVRPEQVGYIETHGTGTRLGDPIEAEALADVYGRSHGSAVYLGAVKTNIGHLEAAAGIAGFIKAALCLSHAVIPPNLHFTRLNSNISFDGTTFAVPTEVTPWPRTDGPRAAGVSSFGLSGTNAHLILEQAPPVPPTPEPDERRPACVLALSARTESALTALAGRYADRLTDGDATPLADLCYSAGTGRSHFRHRLAAVGATRKDVAGLLNGFVRGESAPGLVQGEAGSSDVVFLFTGQGAQRPGMAHGLYDTQPTFRRAVDECARILRPLLDRPLLEVLFPDDPADTLINETAYAQPATFAVEYATAQMWQSWGITPAAVLGHSFGECVAACVAGAMSLEDGLAFAVERARVIQEHALPGTMAAVFAPEAEVAAEITAHRDRVSIAAVNGPAATTISGDRELVETVCAAFAARGVRARPLRIASAGHSPLMEPAVEPLRRAAEKITFTAPRIPLVSNVSGELWPWDQAPGPDYWARHVRATVRFSDGVRTLRGMGYHTFLEVGPAPTLLGAISDALPPGHDDLLLPSLRPRQDDWDVLLPTVAELYAAGAGVDWAGFDADYARAKAPLPTYAFDPVHCWPEPQPGEGWMGASATESTVSDGASTQDEDAPVRQTRASRRARRRAGRIPSAPELLALAEAERLDTLAQRLLLAVKDVLGSTSTDVGLDEPLTGFGLDSLMAVELRNEIGNTLGITLQITDFLGGATIRSVAGRIVEGLAATGSAPRDDAGAPTAIRRLPRAADVSADVAAGLLAELTGSAAHEPGTEVRP